MTLFCDGTKPVSKKMAGTWGGILFMRKVLVVARFGGSYTFKAALAEQFRVLGTPLGRPIAQIGRRGGPCAG